MRNKRPRGTRARYFLRASLSAHVRKLFKTLGRFLSGLFAAKAQAPPHGAIPPGGEKQVFEYMPLDPGAIRVLDLLPGRPGDAAQLVIRHEQFTPHQAVLVGDIRSGGMCLFVILYLQAPLMK